ncbi:MAG: RNA helicase [Bogoriella megaspora]|nr:MAG: RNA helicase [Bogoriella megaspora]
MLRTICPFCESRSILKTLFRSSGPLWAASRTYAVQAQKRRPSRMTLSPKVGQRLDSKSSQEARQRSRRDDEKRRHNSPFGGMNMTQAGVRNSTERSSKPQELRTTRGREKQKKGDAKSGTYKALKMQRALASVSYGKRNSVKESIGQVDSFDHFPLLPLVKDSIHSQALKGLDYVMPTPIQRVAIPALTGSDNEGKMKQAPKREMEQFLLAAETGSGKTLAYLLPLIDAVKRAELADVDMSREEEQRKDAAEKERRSLALFELEAPPKKEPHSTTGRPRAIILLPTSELVTQVGDLVKSLGHTVKYRSALISSSYSGVVIRNRLFSPSGIDIVVSTPHLLASISESDPNILSRVTHLVIDEADSLLDRSFSPLTNAILDKASPSLKQLILCSATIPKSLDSYLHKRFPDIRRLVTPNLHAIPRRVQLGVVDVEREPYRGNKNLACADTIWSIGRAAVEHFDDGEKERAATKRIIVFVNEREKASEVADYLVTKGIDAAALSRDTNEQRQGEVLAAFTSKDTSTDIDEKPEEKITFTPVTLAKNTVEEEVASSKRKLASTKVLVMTDLGSRGIDTLAVRHVILYDVPHTTIDFIHRLGRTGRMNRRGRGIVLVGKGDRRDVVREVREGMFKGQALI